MNLTKTWLVVILVCIGIFYFGNLEQSHLFTFIGAVGIASGGICEISDFLTQFVKRHEK